MNISRKTLLLATMLFLVTTGVITSLIPFGLSLLPSERADAALPRIDISDLAPGSYKLATPDNAYEIFRGFRRSVYFVKTLNGEIKAWLVYAKNGEVGMPDFHWWRSYMTCKDFRPDMLNGTIDENSLIHCHDKDIEPWQADNWQWTLNGKAVTDNTTDMVPARGVVEGNYFVSAHLY